MSSELAFETLHDSAFTPHHYQTKAIESVTTHFYEKGRKAASLVLATGCISGDALVTVNRGGKGVTRSLRDHHRLQFDFRVQSHVVSKVRSYNGSHITSNRFSHIESSGVKAVVRLKFASGRELVCTPDHRVLTVNGWVEASNLCGLAVIVESAPKRIGERQRKKRPCYKQVQALVHHPFASHAVSNRGGQPKRLYRVPQHRLVVESEMNGVSLGEYIDRLRSGDIDSSWRFLDPSVTAVHHVSGDPTDNRVENLQVLSHLEHWSIEGRLHNHLNTGKTLVESDEVVLVDPAGEIDTYDIISVDGTENFVANGVVVHNCGKTVVMAELVRNLVITEQINRALFVVHRNELVKQAIETFELAGLAVGREQGSQNGMALCNPNIICSTVQSMAVRKAKYDPKDFDLILVDEHHHASWDNKQYRGLVEYFDTAKLLGVTATPDRPDGKDMTHFDEVVFSYNLFDAIHDPQGPFLSPVRFVRCDVGVDLRGCRTIGHKGDFDAAELGKRIQPAIEIFANAIAKEIADRQKIIVFMPCVGSSTAMANALKDLGFRADWVSGDRKDKDQVIQDYKKGRLQILVNCQLLLEGFDDKETDTVVLKPTRSRVAYAQAVGRGTRLFPGKKDCLVIDFSHTSDLDLVGPASLAVADIEDAKAIDKLVDQDHDGDLWGAIERNEENKKQRRIFHVPVSRMESMEYRRVEVNPFQTMINLGSNQNQLTSNSFSELASEPQISFLAKSGMGDLGNISKRQASELISKIIDRRTGGLCSLRQLNYLISLGVKPDKARHMSFQEATETISSLRMHS